MASSAVTAAQAELISSLSQDEIPIKLRCAICSRLAVNAFRLPCCEQAICETCQSTLPSSCPVCEHTPVSAEDCKPNKSIRTTIKVFLRTEEKKREALRLKEVKNAFPVITPVEIIPTPIEAPTPTPAEPEVLVDVEKVPSPAAGQTEQNSAPEESTEPLQAEQDIPQPSIEEIAPGQEPTEDGDANQAEATSEENGDGPAPETDTDGQAVNGVSQNPVFGFGFDLSAAGAFPNMGMGGDFNQMQMMMAMQNGMGANSFGNFPMMGMPGMNVDPMAMQNMMMNGGFGGGMGMNGMNMGMGMGGFDGGVGTGFNNGWNGQQSWNVGQDNFNHPNAAGMAHGDYASNNSGYNSHSSGYNQGNYGRGNHYNDYQNNNYGYRGRGRGRGYGRGGHGYGSHDQYSQQFPQQSGSGQQANGPISETGSVPTGPKADAAEVSAGDVDEFGREIRHITESNDVVQDVPTDEPKNESHPNGTTEAGEKAEVNGATEELPNDVEESAPKPIQTLDEAQASYQPNGNYGPSSRGGYSSGHYGRGPSFNNMQPHAVKPVDVPINAPTGPKAMREGLPNTGLSSLRGRGFSIVGRANPAPRVNGSASVAPEPNTLEQDVKERERTKSPSRERSRSRDRKRSGSRDRHNRRHRHRSTSLAEDEKETERRKHRRKERRHNHDERDDREDDAPFEKLADDDYAKQVEEERLRSASPSDSKRSSHRSRRDKDKYRERDRDDRDKYRDRDEDRDYKSSHKHRSSRRHHDDRSRSREKDREHRHRHSRRGSEEVDERALKSDISVPPTPIETEDASRRPSVAKSNMGIEIKGASSRRKNAATEELAIPTGPRSERTAHRDREKDKSGRHRDENDSRHRSSRHRDSDREREKERDRTKEGDRSRTAPSAPAVQDPHTIEREARNRERLLKEAQRIAGLTAGNAGGRKRSRDDGDDTNGRKGRKKRGRGGEENEEARIARLEAERESARWS